MAIKKDKLIITNRKKEDIMLDKRRWRSKKIKLNNTNRKKEDVNVST